MLPLLSALHMDTPFFFVMLLHADHGHAAICHAAHDHEAHVNDAASCCSMLLMSMLLMSMLFMTMRLMTITEGDTTPALEVVVDVVDRSLTPPLMEMPPRARPPSNGAGQVLPRDEGRGRPHDVHRRRGVQRGSSLTTDGAQRPALHLRGGDERRIKPTRTKAVQSAEVESERIDRIEIRSRFRMDQLDQHPKGRTSCGTGRADQGRCRRGRVRVPAQQNGHGARRRR